MKLWRALQQLDIEAEIRPFLRDGPASGDAWINSALVDVRGWDKLQSDVVANRVLEDPLVLLSIWEASAASSALASHHLSEPDFVRRFADPQILKRFSFVGTREPEDMPQAARAWLLWRGSEWDALGYLQLVLRWAQRFCAWQAGDRRALDRLLLSHPLPAVLASPDPSPPEAFVYAAMEDLGLKVTPIDSGVAAHHLPAWILAALELAPLKKSVAQQRLEFKEAGGTPNSIFAVRAVGGTDGYDVRGQPGADLALIIDLGDREVSTAATAFIEKYVVDILNETPQFIAEPTEGSLRLRWFDNRLDARDIGRLIHEALKQRFVLGTVAVNVLFDPLRIASLKPSILAYKEERAQQIKRRSDESAPFVVCTACQAYAAHTFCIATPERPPCCGRDYDELAMLAQLTRTTEQMVIDKGVCIDRSKAVYIGTDKIGALMSHGQVSSLALHAISQKPHPTSAIPEAIIYAMDGVDGLAVVSRDYQGRTPDGKTYSSLLARCAARQSPGLMGISEAYLASPRFLAADGGLARVVWMDSAVKGRMSIRLGHIATEMECSNIAGLKEYLQSWRR